MDKKRLNIYFYIAFGIMVAGMGFYLSARNAYHKPVSEGVAQESETSGLSEAGRYQTIELKDGDSYDLSAGFVKQNLGGKEYKLVAYNGSIPGPLIKVRQGSRITINFKNNTDTSMAFYPHGVRTKGDESYSQQRDVSPGEALSYEIDFPDAGIFWYHPYFKNGYGGKSGLYGGFLVMSQSDEYWNEVNREEVVFLSDISFEDSKNMFGAASSGYSLINRFGNTILANGRTNYEFSADSGEVVRFYIVNSSNYRPFNFGIGGMKMKVVGGDGGAYEREELKESVFIGPSERAVVEVLFAEQGRLNIQSLTPEKTHIFGEIMVRESEVTESLASQFAKLRTNNEAKKSIDLFRPYLEGNPEKQIELTVGVGESISGGTRSETEETLSGSQVSQMLGISNGAATGNIEWDRKSYTVDQVLEQSFSSGILEWKAIDLETKATNMNINWAFEEKRPVKIRIKNSGESIRPMQQSIHFRGQRFIIISPNQKDNYVWRDTVFIPSGQVIDIVLDASNTGHWIADSGYLGAVFGFRVE